MSSTATTSHSVDVRSQRWIRWLLTVATAVAIGVVLIPLVRSWPTTVHDFCNDLASWQRHLFIFGLCVLFAHLMFKLLSPRPSHLRYFFSNPPIWFAWLIGIVCVAALDLRVGLSHNTYYPTLSEWLGYAGGSVAVIVIYKCIMFSGNDPTVEKSLASRSGTAISWPELERWLASDSPAQCDFLGSHAAADRLAMSLLSGTRSIGIVGPFGAGKTSLVEWILENTASAKSGKTPTLLPSKHSCWRFKDSASSIHAMLAGAVAGIGERIDTFNVSSLPESYRQTFSAGGEWFETVSNMLLAKHDPIEQFRGLSELLATMNSRLVLVVEDLDRNESNTFNINEVLGFLQQLKEFENFSFVLTGGLNSPARIDFAKLCDHIEYLKGVGVAEAAQLVSLLRDRCLDQAAFPHEVLTDTQHNQWNPTSWLLMADYDEVWPPQAIATLLNTPRALRHALGRTYRAWQTLFGEIDWDHLLTVNVLRSAAPECFSFVVRHWHRFCRRPSANLFGQGQLEKVQARLKEEWNSITHDVEWDARSARALMDFILPNAPLWFGENSSSNTESIQGVQNERYWLRAINEAIDPSDVPDQIVIRDVKQWLQSPSVESSLVAGLCGSEEYSDVWEHLAPPYFARDAKQVLLLSQQVLTAICTKHASAASSDSQGFIAVWRVANRWIRGDAGARQWLEDRIAEAMPVSLALVNDLFHYWGSGRNLIVQQADTDELRRYVLKLAKERLVDAQELNKVLSPKSPYAIYQLVFDPGAEGPSVHSDSESWNWLGPILLDGINNGKAMIAIQVCNLIAARQPGAGQNAPAAADMTILKDFFGNNARTLIGALGRITGQWDEGDRTFVHEIVDSGAARLPTPESTGDQ